MSSFYQDIQREVSALLLELGKPFEVRSKGAYNETTMSYAAPTIRSVQGIVSDSSLRNTISGLSMGALAVDKDTRGSKVILFDASLAPKTTDEVNVDGNFFSLEKIQEVKPSDVVLLYILDVTK